MSKKFLIIFAIIILVVGFSAYVGLFNSTFKVGDTTFNMPKGYHEGKSNYLGAVNITDGNTTVFFEEKDVNVIQDINKYKKMIWDDRNQTVLVSNYTIDGNLFYKSTIKENPGVMHCWFVKNNKTYDIYTWDGNNDLDMIVINCYNSI